MFHDMLKAQLENLNGKGRVILALGTSTESFYDIMNKQTSEY